MSNDLEITGTPETPETRGLSRRQVVRTGAHLAWAVPAVSVVTAAPALAASGKAKLKLSTFSASASTTKITLKLGAVKNLGPGDAGVPTAQFSLSPTPKNITKIIRNGGWSQSGGSKSLKFVSSQGPLKAGKSTAALTVTVSYKKAKKAPKGTAKVVVVASNSAPLSVSDSDRF